jgi:hypothetical protein
MNKTGWLAIQSSLWECDKISTNWQYQPSFKE